MTNSVIRWVSVLPVYKFFNHLIELLWRSRLVLITLILLIIIFWSTPQGQDLIVGLPEVGAIGNLRVIMIFVEISIIGLVLWYLSRFVFGIDYSTRESGDKTRFKINKYLPRFFGVFTVMIMAMGAFKIYATYYMSDDISIPPIDITGCFFVALLLTGIIVWATEGMKNIFEYKSYKYVYWIILIVNFLGIVFFSWYKDSNENLLFFSISMTLQAFLLGGFFTLRRIKPIWPSIFQNSFFTQIPLPKLFFLIALIATIIFLGYNIYPKLDIIYPTSIIIYALIAYTYWIALLMRFSKKRKLYLVTSLLVLLVVGAAINNSSFVDIDLHETRMLDGRQNQLNSNDYLSHWLDLRSGEIDDYVETTGSKYPVFLVMGEGGGSRAAYWTNSVLSYLHDHSNFTRHCLAISTASGSTFGAGSYLAFLYHNDKEKILEKNDGAFVRNYLSSSLAYFMGRDFFFTVVPFIHKLISPTDRAFKLEKEWAVGIEKVIRPGSQTVNIEEPIFEKPLLSFYNEDGEERIQLPLLFSNSTRIEDGSRAIVSPLHLNKNYHHDVIDIMDNLPPGKTLRLGTAIHLSSRFPFINPAGEIPGLGHFVDAGYYDNLGATTMSEFYNMINDRLVNSGLDSLMEIHLVMVFNGENGFVGKQLNKYPNLDQIRIPFYGILNVRGGHTEYLYHTVSQKVSDDRLHIIELNHKYIQPDGTKAIMPVARSLSRRAANQIKANLFDSTTNNTLTGICRLAGESISQ